MAGAMASVACHLFWLDVLPGRLRRHDLLSSRPTLAMVALARVSDLDRGSLGGHGSRMVGGSAISALHLKLGHYRGAARFASLWPSGYGVAPRSGPPGASVSDIFR